MDFSMQNLSTAEKMAAYFGKHLSTNSTSCFWGACYEEFRSYIELHEHLKDCYGIFTELTIPT